MMQIRIHAQFGCSEVNISPFPICLYISTSLKRFHYVSFEKEGTIIWLRYSALVYLLFKFYFSLKGICAASAHQITGEKKMCRG